MVESDRTVLVSDNDEQFDRDDEPRLLPANAYRETTVPASQDAEAQNDSGASDSGLGAAKWFILEPAVFLIFMARSLIGGIM